MKSEMTEIASKTLGDSTSYAVYTDKYDPTLLNPMPRALARTENNITGDEFDGFDVWHCYEATFLTDLGHPVSGIMKIIYPADTKMMIESKSMKLFLNSFDMCKMGQNVRTAISNYNHAVRQSISECLEDSRVEVNFFRHVDILNESTEIVDNELLISSELYDICEHESEYSDINHVYNSEKTDFIEYHKHLHSRDIHLMFESLRSRCRHTKQKDTGTAIVRITDSVITKESIYKQINSMRETNEFHEFCAERLFTHLNTNEKSSVIVALLYTRRGSLDINPVRYSKKIDNFEYNNYIRDFLDVNTLTLPSIIQ